MEDNYVLMDGNEAAAYVSYAFTEVAGIFPITPSSPMAEHVDSWASQGKKNIFGKPVKVVEMQSEGGAAGTVHGSLQSGALTTTYTASQGLLLMIPNMYKISGEFLPGVFHVSARTLSVHGLSIFGDHSDVMGCRMTGFCMLASSSPQEVMDLGAVSHLSAIRGHLPFLHYFDGFRTSHEIDKIKKLNYDDLKELVDYNELEKFRANSLNPEHPRTRGTTVNPDIFFQCREGLNETVDKIPDIVSGYMDEINKLTGKDYKLFNYYGSEDAEYVIVAMCSVTETIKEAVDYLNSIGKKVGMINVHLYRPFSNAHFLSQIPNTVKKIAVLDRTKEPGGMGEPLYQDVCTAIFKEKRDIEIIGGRYGLSSKDTTPGQIVAVFNNLFEKDSKDNFTIGIIDDVTNTSLPIIEEPKITHNGLTSCVFWGMGSDGTVGANKNSVKIIGKIPGMYAQAYFVYDSKKSGGLTQSHLRFGNEEIHAPYLILDSDFVAVHNPSYVYKYDTVKNLKEGGTYLLNTSWSEEELEDKLPNSMKKALFDKKAKFYTIDAIKIAKELGLGGRTNSVLQSAFFKLSNVMPLDKAIDAMKKAVYDTYYLKKGQEVCDLNYKAIDMGITSLNEVKIKESWGKIEVEVEDNSNVPEFIKDVVIPMNRQEGDKLPISLMKKYGLLDGTWHNGTTKYEKRGAANEVPTWIKENCLECNQCSLACPHAAIRPVLLDKDEKANAPESFDTKKAVGRGFDNYEYRLQVSPLDCTGCNSCVNVCPAKEKALKMVPLDTVREEENNWEYAINKVKIKEDVANDSTIKSSQFMRQYFEFSGACAGCGETPYIKLVTGLFGDRMYITNASGCSSAYGGSTPSTPYTKDERGFGPSWAMSLFEDNAEYAFGYLLGYETIKSEVKEKVESLLGNKELENEVKDYLLNMEDKKTSRAYTDALLEKLNSVKDVNDKEKVSVDFILKNKEFMSKKSVWAFGGDGWAYDIGYGGLDHVLASGKDINVLVLDTEVYSNTGGQASKSTGTGAIAKFQSSGKEVKKKDLGLMAINYGYCYVAQIALGADPNQAFKAIKEGESYNGPSLIIAYCPCIEHGVKSGMGRSQEEMKKAVECGYWHLYRYNPELKEKGENPFILDSKEPTFEILPFLKGENRYASLSLTFPEKADRYFEKAKNDLKERYEKYKKLAEN